MSGCPGVDVKLRGGSWQETGNQQHRHQVQQDSPKAKADTLTWHGRRVGKPRCPPHAAPRGWALEAAWLHMVQLGLFPHSRISGLLWCQTITKVRVLLIRSQSLGRWERENIGEGALFLSLLRNLPHSQAWGLWQDIQGVRGKSSLGNQLQEMQKTNT